MWILPRKKRPESAFFHFYYVKVPLQKCLQLLQNKFQILFVFTNIVAKTIIYHYILWFNLELKYFFCLMVFKNAKKTSNNTTPLPTGHCRVPVHTDRNIVPVPLGVPWSVDVRDCPWLYHKFIYNTGMLDTN